MRHVLYIYDNRDKNKPTNRLIKKVIKIVIRKSDGSLRFVVSKDDVSTASIQSLLLLEPTYSSEIKLGKRLLKYDVIVKGENHDN